MGETNIVRGEDRRKYERIKLYLPGQLFNPLNNQTNACKVLNLSAGGARVQSQTELSEGMSLVLNVESFGRFEGTTLPPYETGHFGIRFTIGERRRGHLLDMLTCLGRSGMADVSHLREHERIPTLVKGSIVRENGKHLTCDVLDISLDGLSVRTKWRPHIGEIVSLGQAHGRVIRHNADGIAIQYVRESGFAA
jgi:hypothetical protein